MARAPNGSSEWTSAVEAAVETELLRRGRRLQWAVVLALLVGGTAVALAVALRGVTWGELQAELKSRLAPQLKTQISQGEATIALAREIDRLDAEVSLLRAEVEARRAEPDGERDALRRRLVRLERALNDATTERARLEMRIEDLRRAVERRP